MLVNLTLSDFLIAITGFLTQFSPKNDQTCTLNIFLSLVGFWSSAFWSAIVAIFSYKKTANSHDFNSNSFFKRALAIWLITCVFIPLLPVFGFMEARYLANDKFCAISLDTSPIVLFLISEGIPIFTAIIITTIAYIKQVRALKKMPRFMLMIMNVKANRLFYYPIAQCLVFIPGLICQLIYVFWTYDSTFLNIIRLYGFRLAGLVNSGVYGLQRVQLGKSQASILTTPTMAESLLEKNIEGMCSEDDEIIVFEEQKLSSLDE